MPGYKHIKSVVNALDALELVSTAPGGLPLHVIARVLGLKKQTAHHLVRTLAHKGFLLRSGSPPRYILASAMEGLRQGQSRWSRRLLARAIPKAIRISRQTGAEVTVAQLVGGSVIARHRVPLRRSDPPEHHSGWRVAPYGSGLILQAFMDAPTLSDFRDRFPLTGSAKQFWKSYKLLDEFLERVRDKGRLACCLGGTFRTSAVIRDSDGGARTILTLTRPIEMMSPHQPAEAVELIGKAAEELTAEIGGEAGI